MSVSTEKLQMTRYPVIQLLIVGSAPPQAIEALRKLETDAATLRQEAHNMEQAELMRNQQALQRRLSLVSPKSAVPVLYLPRLRSRRAAAHARRLTCDDAVE